MSPNQFDAEMVEVKKDAQLGCKEILDHLHIPAHREHSIRFIVNTQSGPS